MQKLWKHSLYVSSLCHVLADQLPGINREDALLAGLVNDIGIIPLFQFAEQHPEEFPDIEQLNPLIPYLRGPMGKVVMQSLDFSDEFICVPSIAENWLYDSGAKIQLADVVILGKLHSYFGTEQAKELPYIHSIPAYAKLKDAKLNADFSLNIIQQAQQRINDTMNLFS